MCQRLYEINYHAKNGRRHYFFASSDEEAQSYFVDFHGRSKSRRKDDMTLFSSYDYHPLAFVFRGEMVFRTKGGDLIEVSNRV